MRDVLIGLVLASSLIGCGEGAKGSGGKLDPNANNLGLGNGPSRPADAGTTDAERLRSEAEWIGAQSMACEVDLTDPRSTSRETRSYSTSKITLKPGLTAAVYTLELALGGGTASTDTYYLPINVRDAARQVSITSDVGYAIYNYRDFDGFRQLLTLSESSSGKISLETDDNEAHQTVSCSN